MRVGDTELTVLGGRSGCLSLVLLSVALSLVLTVLITVL